MFWRLRLAVPTAIALFFGSVSGTQNPPLEKVSTYVTYLNVWKNRDAVTDLKAEEITVSGHAGQKLPIVSLQPASAAPLVLALIIDASGSRRDQFPKAEIEPAINFVRQLDANWQAAVLRFSDDVYLHTALTTNREQLETGIRQAASNYWGSSAPYDALVLATQKILAKPNHRRAIIIISDGVDNSSIIGGEADSRLAAQTAAGFLSLNGTMVYFVLLMDSSGPKTSRRDALRNAETVVERTGGMIFAVEDRQHFQRAFDGILVALRSQYMLSFQQSNSYKGMGASPTRRPKITTTRRGLELNSSQIQKVSEREN